jgi:flagellar protein FliO/FliZ
MLGGVGLVCAALSGLAYWVRRRRVTTGGTSTTIQVMAARSLGPRHRLAVVEVGGRTLLLGVGSEAINLLADLTDPIAFSETLHERMPVDPVEHYAELEQAPRRAQRAEGERSSQVPHA